MGLPNVFHTGRSGMMASRAAIATTGHNIANANTEGFSRQRVQTETEKSRGAVGSRALVGAGAQVARIERINDEYIERQIRNGTRDLSNLEEKDVILRQAEDIFNEMGGEGLNRIISKFFNEFRKLSNEPNSEAVRQSVREATQAMVNDFHRLRNEVDEIRRHIDARIEAHCTEVNSLGDELKDLNTKIKIQEIGGAPPNDLLDKRDQVVKRLSSFMDVAVHKDNEGSYTVDVKGMGPFVVGGYVERFSVERSPADDQGKPEGSLEIRANYNAKSNVTHVIHGGKLGALLETRDKTLSTIMGRLDDLAFNLSNVVNQAHVRGFTRSGQTEVALFKPLAQRERAAEYLQLSDAVRSSVNNIATASAENSPGDNRIALAIAGLQGALIMGDGRTTVDDWYNSIVSEVGVAAGKTRSRMTQQKDIMTQLNKMRDQISGVSIDEETANLMQFQHVFDASSKVIQVADEMLKTVLSIKG